MKVFKVQRPDCGKQWCIYKDAHTVLDAELMESEIGDTLVIELMEMPEDEVNNLPEFEGW